LPTPKPAVVLTMLFVLLASTVGSAGLTTTTGRLSDVSLSPTLSSSLGAALHWLAANQSSNGSYGAYEEHLAAAAAYALWLNDSTSPKAALSYSWLATQLNSSSAWFWGTEADVPGAVLYSIASSTHLHLINATSVAANLLQLQQPKNGFEGYYDLTSDQTVTSSVDTDMALLGLTSLGLIPVQNETSAVNYLLSLQNPDGSFNLTSTISSDPIYSLGPDRVSITSMTLLALKSSGFTTDDARISSGLKFLSNALQANYGGNGHVYSAALSTIAFKAYDQPDQEITATVYVLSQQNSDGGFSDSTRSSYPQSNALDTGWAAIALETRSSEEGPSSPVNSPPVAAFSFTPQEPTVGVEINFNASTSHDSDGDKLSYLWTFGDGTSAQSVNPTHTYSEAGNFTVTLTAIDSGTNPRPLSNTKSLTITVQPVTVQKSSTLPISNTILSILVGAIGLVAIAGVAFYLGRRTAKRPVAYSV
jgi:PKD repeat protein